MLDELLHKGSEVRRRPVLKKQITNLKAKGSRYLEVNDALDLLLDGPTKQQFKDFKGQHELFDNSFAFHQSTRRGHSFGGFTKLPIAFAATQNHKAFKPQIPKFDKSKVQKQFFDISMRQNIAPDWLQRNCPANDSSKITNAIAK